MPAELSKPGVFVRTFASFAALCLQVRLCAFLPEDLSRWHELIIVDPERSFTEIAAFDCLNNKLVFKLRGPTRLRHLQSAQLSKLHTLLFKGAA